MPYEDGILIVSHIVILRDNIWNDCLIISKQSLDFV